MSETKVKEKQLTKEEMEVAIKSSKHQMSVGDITKCINSLTRDEKMILKQQIEKIIFDLEKQKMSIYRQIDVILDSSKSILDERVNKVRTQKLADEAYSLNKDIDTLRYRYKRICMSIYDKPGSKNDIYTDVFTPNQHAINRGGHRGGIGGVKL